MASQCVRVLERTLLPAVTAAALLASAAAFAQLGGTPGTPGAAQAERQGPGVGARNALTWASSPGAAPPGTALVLLPTVQSRRTRMVDGCWVRFFDQKNFGGDTLTLAGPMDLPHLRLVRAWHDWDSAIAGPKATLRAFDDENFGERTAILQPGQSMPDLHGGATGWLERVESVQVSCS